MYILKILKPIRINGEIVEPGQIVKAIDIQGLTEKGYARRLAEDETRTILSGYVKHAEDLFSETPQKKTISVNRENKALYQGRLL
jgi:hypothetical protein